MLKMLINSLLPEIKYPQKESGNKTFCKSAKCRKGRKQNEIKTASRRKNRVEKKPRKIALHVNGEVIKFQYSGHKKKVKKGPKVKYPKKKK